MELSQLNFAHPYFLWAGLAIPLIAATFWLFYHIHSSAHQLDKFIDPHLLPYLLLNKDSKKLSSWKNVLLWTIGWSFLTIALAGPRWDFRELETFSKDQSLVILLDLSDSMNAADVKPSRLVRAKQKIEDLINSANGVKMGLIAFAADPHIISPLTDDSETIRYLLSSLDTDLIYIQGSRLSPALELGYALLEADLGHNKAMVVMSDGGFEDAGAIKTAKSLAEKGIVIHAMGIGTAEGAPVVDHEGNLLKKNGNLILSKLDKERFSEISKAGNGHYLEAHHSSHEEDIVLNELNQRAEAQLAQGKKTRIWEEKFYLPLLLALPLFLGWFRKGAIFALVIMISLPVSSLHADFYDHFKNNEQLGKQALDKGDYETSITTFQDPYRKGVACYKAGKFAEAEALFRQSSRPDIACSAGYNLGNALAQQLKLKEAVQAYEEVLKQWPDHTKAKENLELVKKMLEQQKDNQTDSDNSDPQDNQEQDNDQNNKDNQNGESKSHKQDQQDNQNSQPSPQSNKEPEKDNKGSAEQDSTNETQHNEHDDQKKDSQEVDRDQDSQNEQSSQPAERDEKDKSANEAANDDEAKTQADYDADLLLNRISNDPKAFMKNKFYIESKKNETKEGVDPW